MADTENNVWVNTLMTKELADKLDEMVAENGSTRAAFVRLLIEREYVERKRLAAQKKSSLSGFKATKMNRKYPTKDYSPT
jgi:metal-responsive CopG/Arc/MetJ family transcriptional regulator